MCAVDLQQIMANKTYPEAGTDLYNILEDKICKEEKIVLDLNGVVSLPSMFLNTSIGKFIEVHGADLLKQKVSFARISVIQAERLKDYIARIQSK